MFDIKWIRDNPREFDAGLTRRGLSPQAVEIVALDAERRKAVTAAQDIQSRRNALSKEIGAAKSKGDDAAGLIEKVASEKELQATAERQAASLSKELDDVLAGIPNLADTDVPDGADDTANVEIRSFGEKPAFDFTPKEHFDIGEGLGGMDFEGAAKLSGSRFVVLKGALARLSRALGAFMLDLQTNEFGYTEIIPPLLVRDDVLFGTGQLPKFAADQFRTTDDYWLIPTAEVPLTNLVRETILEETDLPLKLVGISHCFRTEAGAHGRESKGLYRVHQFTKVETFVLCRPEDSEAMHEQILKIEERILQALEIPYRVIDVASGDLGAPAYRKYDIEAWMPGRGEAGEFGEVTSASNCTDFQARRLKTRFRRAATQKNELVHTLNGTAVALSRTPVALLENHQQADGSVTIPKALQPNTGFDRIGPR